MKKITTTVIDYNNNGTSAVTFKKSIDELPTYIRDIANVDKGTVDKNGVHNWFFMNYHVMADASALAKNDGTSITWGIAIFPTPMEQALQQMGIVVVPNRVNVTLLCEQLMDTYRAMGVNDWIKQGIPSGVRSIVAFRYGYMLNVKFNSELDAAMKMADDILREEQSPK